MELQRKVARMATDVIGNPSRYRMAQDRCDPQQSCSRLRRCGTRLDSVRTYGWSNGQDGNSMYFQTNWTGYFEEGDGSTIICSPSQYIRHRIGTRCRSAHQRSKEAGIATHCIAFASDFASRHTYHMLHRIIGRTPSDLMAWG